MGASYLINYGTATLKLNSAAVLGAGVVGAVTLGIGVIVSGTLRPTSVAARSSSGPTSRPTAASSSRCARALALVTICTYVLKETRQRNLEDIMLPTATLAE